MATLKKMNSKGSFDYVQVTGEDVTKLRQDLENTSQRLEDTSQQLAQTETQMVQSTKLLRNITVDVTDIQFGAIGDGITNDTEAIQSAIDYVYAKGGGNVYFPSGVYLCNILLYPYVSLKGENEFTVMLKSVPNSNRDVIKSWDFDKMTESPSGTRPTKAQATRFNWLENLTVDGNYDNNIRGSGIKVYGCIQFWNNIYVQNCRDYGIVTEYNTQTTVNTTGREDMRWNMLESVYEKITVNGCDKDGWLYRGPHDSTVKELVIARCTGWGFNQDDEYGSNNGLKIHNANIYLVGNGMKLNMTCKLSGDTRLDNNNKGIGLLFKYSADSSKGSQFIQASKIFLSGWDTALDMAGTFHNIDATINNCGNNLSNEDTSAIVLRNVSGSKLNILARGCAKYVHIDTTKTLGSGNIMTFNFLHGSQSYLINGTLSSVDFVRMVVMGNPSSNFMQEPYDTIKSRGGLFTFPITAPGMLLTTTLQPTATTRGGVIQKTAPTTLTADPTATDFNNLISLLKSAGVLS